MDYIPAGRRMAEAVWKKNATGNIKVTGGAGLKNAVPG